jgi:hypothetical protein
VERTLTHLDLIERAVVGLDLGKHTDPTAICVASAIPRESPLSRHDQAWHDQFEDCGRDCRILAEDVFTFRDLGVLPLGIDYVAVAHHVTEVVSKVARQFQDRPRLVVDATGVGAPVLDILRDTVGDVARIVPMTIVAGADFIPGGQRVGKAWLLGRLQALFERGCIRLPFPEDESDRIRGLIAELRAFEIKATQTGLVTAAAPSGAHDDRVIALLLATMEDPSKTVIRFGRSLWR